MTPAAFIASRRSICAFEPRALAVRGRAARRDRRAFCASSSARSRSGTAGSCSGAIRSSPKSRFSAGYFETDFASFLAWRDWGFPGPRRLQRLWHGRAAFVRRRVRARRNGPAHRQCGPHLFSVRNARSRRYQGRRGRYCRQRRPRSRRRKPVLTPADYHGERALGLRGFGRFDRDDPDIATSICRAKRCARGSRPILPGSASPNFRRSIWCASARDLTAAMPRFVTAFIEQAVRAC